MDENFELDAAMKVSSIQDINFQKQMAVNLRQKATNQQQ
jgi:hypothetical protein